MTEVFCFLKKKSKTIINIPVTLKLVKKVLINFDLSKPSGPDYVPVVGGYDKQ